MVFAGLEEAQLVLDMEGENSAAALADGLYRLGPAQAVIKDGARGCTALQVPINHPPRSAP